MWVQTPKLLKTLGSQSPPCEKEELMTDVSSDQYWSNRYTHKQTGWDENAPHPFWVQHFQNVKASSDAALILGAGRGHDAVFLSSFFEKTYALDFSERAKKEFHKLYPNSSVEFVLADLFTYSPQKPVDAVFEHTCLCAIDPKRRKEYFATVNRVLKNDGEYHAILFPEANPVDQDKPPFSTPIEDVKSFLNQLGFVISEERPIHTGFASRTFKEIYLKALKKTKDES